MDKVLNFFIYFFINLSLFSQVQKIEKMFIHVCAYAHVGHAIQTAL